MTPIVIQRSRRKGSKLVSPNGLPVVCVSRPSVFGNPFKAKAAVAVGYKDGAAMAVWAFRVWLGVQWEDAPEFREAHPERRRVLLERLPELKGKNLACWCRPRTPCHAVTLLDLANRPEPFQP
jgi:hypothetical protein